MKNADEFLPLSMTL
ncbi:unnamed protein product [Lathyrus oleraceus]